METKRFILILSLGLVIMMLWQEWQHDYGVPVAGQGQDQQEAIHAEDLPTLSLDSPPQTPQVEEQYSDTADDTAFITVTTDVLDLQIALTGGTIRKASLLDYPIDKNKPDAPFVLLDQQAKAFHIAQSGLLSKDPAPDHSAIYQSAAPHYTLDDQDQLTVDLYWQSDSGITVIKTFTLTRGSYLIDMRYQINNDSAAPWRGGSYAQLQRTEPTSTESRFIYTYTGAVISTPTQRYEKISFADMRDNTLDADIVNGWAAMLQHYFFSALIPKKDQSHHYYTKVIDRRNSYIIGATSAAIEIAPGAMEEITYQLYIGPKTQKILTTIADNLELVVDYGALWFIAKPLFFVLDKLHLLTNNWGWAIIILTLLIKILFYNLSAAGYRSMANMRRVQPRIIAIRDRYKNDRQRLNQAMMELYKTEKINPLGGCFPILIQIPVFIALYWVLLESVEIRQAHFALWINDLSSPDSYYVLPIMMGLTMYIQQKLNPAPMEPIQEKVLSLLPIILTVFFAFFPSGLVLYWVASNILSIAQQWLINRGLKKAGLK